MLTLNGMMDTSHQSKNLFKMQTFNGDKQKILLGEKKKIMNFANTPQNICGMVRKD